MKACISVLGRFHAFDLARELHRHGALARLVTSYPKFAAARFGVPRALVTSLPSSELLRRGSAWLPRALRDRANPQRFVHAHFEARAARKIPEDADLFVGWSGAALAGIERAQALGMTTVVERGSSHMLAQRRILTEEYEAFGLTPQVAHPAVVEKELLEYERADFIAVPSRFVRRTFLEEGVDAAKLIHVPYGVSLEHFRPPPPGAREADPVFRVIHVGAVSLRKGCHYLLRAFQELDLPRSELWFVGPVAPEMKPFRERWASERVVFHAPVPQAQLVDFYARASVFCLASIEEGLALVTAQAMACGLPVVATTNTGAEDLVNDGTDGFVVPVRDVAAIAEKLEQLYRHPDLRRAMGASALERVSSGFRWQDYGERVVRAYGIALRTVRPPLGAKRDPRGAERLLAGATLRPSETQRTQPGAVPPALPRARDASDAESSAAEASDEAAA